MRSSFLITVHSPLADFLKKPKHVVKLSVMNSSGRFKISSSTLRRIWTKLYAAELVLSTTGQTEISSLLILSCALIFFGGRGGSEGLNCKRNLTSCS